MLSARAAPARSSTPRGETLPGDRTVTVREPVASRTSTPREVQQAWQTPREPGAGGDASALKRAGLGLAQQPRVKRGVDPAPHVPCSGKPGDLGELGALSRRGLQKDLIPPTPRTPDLHGARNRHRQRTGPGEISQHWALKEDSIPDPGPGYGVKTFKDEDVAENFKAGQVLGVAEYMISRGEAIYHSTTREPLGKSYVRGHALPAHTQEQGFRGFGVSRRSLCGAKESIFPRGVAPESAEAHAQYCKTHGSHEAGEMALRRYEWPEAVTGNRHFRFGLVDDVDIGNRGAGAKRALTMDAGDEHHAVLDTRIGTHRLENKRQVANDHLGTARSSRQGTLPVPPDHAFGQRRAQGLDAGTLLRGFYSPEERLPDADLGACLLPGRRNYATTVPFGIPSVRTDQLHRVPAPHQRPMANSTNFGDDPDAVDLIFPGKFNHRGVGDEDMCVRRDGQELRSILEGAGYYLDEGAFQEVFQAAVDFYGDDIPKASTEALMAAYFNVTGDPRRR